MLRQEQLNFANRDVRRALLRKSVHTRADRRERERTDAMFRGELQGPAVRARELAILAIGAAIPDGPDRVDHELRGQPVATRQLGVAGVASAKCAAFFE